MSAAAPVRPVSGRRARRALTWGLVVGAGGCAGTSDVRAPTSSGDEACLVTRPGLVAPAAGTGDPFPQRPVVVGLSGPLDPHTRLPDSPAERFLFAHLYETLVRVDCEGRVEPGLAASWSVEDEGRRWTFRLRSDVRDHDGEAVTAASVGSSWRRAGEARSRRSGRADAALSTLTRVSVADARTLNVELARPVDPAFFAHPELSVRTGSDEAGWPIGSGPYRITGGAEGVADASGRAPSVVSLAGPYPVQLRPVQFPPVSGDGRDALDAGVELLPTSDPVVIDYARRHVGFTAEPLAWDRTYLLASGTPRSDASRSTDAPPRAYGPAVLPAPADVLDGLARDAVRVPARAAIVSPNPEICAVGEPVDRRPARVRVRSSRIVYPADDTVARALAERLVALALDASASTSSWLMGSLPAPGGNEQRLRAAGLSEVAFANALRSGRDAAYVFPVEGRGCAAIAAAVDGAPWLGGARDPAYDRNASIVPLIETRSTLVVRRGVGGVRVDGRGTLRLNGLHRLEPVESEERP